MLDACYAGALRAATSLPLLAELRDVLERPKFRRRLALIGVTAQELVQSYTGLATPVEPADIGTVVAGDPDDDAVLACAVAARAKWIVSGDDHLLRLGTYQGIVILHAAAALEKLSAGDFE